MKKGFTITEIIIVIAIITLVTVLAVEGYQSLSSSKSLEKDRALVSSLLHEARILTLSSKGNMQYGVHFTTSSATLFIGSEYMTASSSDVVYEISPSVRLIADLEDSGSDVVFERLTGMTAQSGTITFIQTSNSNASTSLQIFGTGVLQSN